MDILTTPDGRSAESHIQQIKKVGEYLSFDQRCQLTALIEHSQSGASMVMGSSLASLDVLSEIDQSVHVLKTLRSQLIGTDGEGRLSKQDSETIKAIAMTLNLVIKSSQLLASTGRVSVLQKGLMSYADTLAPDKRLIFIDSIKRHINSDLSSQL
jgi:hypothetical protein